MSARAKKSTPKTVGCADPKCVFAGMNHGHIAPRAHPGPQAVKEWRAVCDGGRWEIRSFGSGSPVGATVAFDVRGDVDFAAVNAHLAAAAPDGHALLLEIAEVFRTGGDFQLGPKGRHADLMPRLSAYFAKARGEHV